MTEPKALTLFFALPPGMDYWGLHDVVASEFRAAKHVNPVSLPAPPTAPNT